MKINDLEKMIRLSWSKETCSPGFRESYTEDNPSLGQCAITSMIVYNYIGGKIMRCMASTGSHYYNLINGEIVDLTVEQFQGEIPDYSLGEERTMEYLLSNEDTKKRYLELLKNLRENFLKYGEKEYKLTDKDGEYLSKIPGMIGGNKKDKIYGRMDCPSALRYIEMGKYVQNRVFFLDEEDAIECGYRPCSKCMRKKYLIWKNKEEL